jgi:hypothetical protein
MRHPPKRNQSASRRPPRPAADRAAAKRLLDAARAGADVRTGKVRQVRAAIRARTYENDLKLAVALQRLRDLVREEAALLAELPDDPHAAPNAPPPACPQEGGGRGAP